jgi:5-methylcytosine-specific restriction endonuclease McrA
MNPTKHQAAAKAWREANPERSAELTASWHARNPGGRVLHEMARRARKKGAGGSHTVAQIIDLAERQNHQCVYCKCSIAKIRHIDHRMPLALGGSNGIENIQLLCPSCNHRKQAKDPLKFAQELGILL